MDIKSVNFNSVQKTNFGLMTSAARKQLNSLIKQNNSGMDEDGRIKLSYFETSKDFILDYYKNSDFFKFNSINTKATKAYTDMSGKNLNIGDFLRKLFLQSEKLADMEKTAAKREKPLTLDYLSKE